MRYVFCLTLTIALATGCEQTVSLNEQERFHARAASEESRVREYVKRAQWARDKTEEYYPVVEQAESDLAAIRGEVKALRERNAKAARDVGILTEEARKLDADKKSVTDAIAALKAEIGELRARLEALKDKRAGAAERIDALIAELEEEEDAEKQGDEAK